MSQFFTYKNSPLITYHTSSDPFSFKHLITYLKLHSSTSFSQLRLFNWNICSLNLLADLSGALCANIMHLLRTFPLFLHFSITPRAAQIVKYGFGDIRNSNPELYSRSGLLSLKAARLTECPYMKLFRRWLSKSSDCVIFLTPSPSC